MSNHVAVESAQMGDSTDNLPTKLVPVRIKGPASAAGGIPSVWMAVRFAAREMGWVAGTRTLLRVNQRDGFDCPGCAWPDPEHRGVVEFCENGAKAVAHEATRSRVERDFFEAWPISALLDKTDYWLERQGRLTEPMLRRPGSDHYEAISWSDAFSRIADHLNQLDSPDDAIFYTSGRTSNEAAFLYQLFVRQFGTNNLPDCSNMCHESSGKGLTDTIGVGKGTVSLADFELADAIFILGQNPGTNHPRMLVTLEAAKRRGCKIICVNPLREPGLVRFKHPQKLGGLVGRGTALADQYLQVGINGDVALLKGIGKAVLEAEREHAGEVLDHEFIHRHTVDFDAYRDALDKTNWDEITDGCGVSRDEIRAAAQVYVTAERTIICWAMGLTQHENGVANIQEIVNLLLLRGNLGRPGAGACPVRGHSNVQGDRTMGISEAPDREFLERLGDAFDFEPPAGHGFNAVQTIEAMASGKGRVFFAMGGNFVAAAPDTAYTEAAMWRCELTVHVSTKLNRSHLVTGETALILPCITRSERDEQEGGTQFVTVENSMSVVHASRGRRDPASPHLLSEPRIVAELARATLGAAAGGEKCGTTWDGLVADYDRIRDRIEQVVPGFAGYNRAMREPGWLLLPNGARERAFRTRSGKAHFTVNGFPKHDLGEGEYLMMTIRSHDQYNTTIYGLDDRYRGVFKERRVVFMNPNDIDQAGFQKGQLVDLISHFEGVARTARGFIVVPYDIPQRCTATYFPEANPLVPVGQYAKGSFTPASKSVRIEIRPAAPGDKP